MVYGQDFPETWLGDSLIIGASSGVPIKRGATETISAATAPSKGKDVKSKKMKAADVGESTGGVEIGSEARRRKEVLPFSLPLQILWKSFIYYEYAQRVLKEAGIPNQRILKNHGLRQSQEPGEKKALP